MADVSANGCCADILLAELSLIYVCSGCKHHGYLSLKHGLERGHPSEPHEGK